MNFCDLSSFSINAKMMGIGKQKTNVRTPRMMVFWKACQKLGSLMNRVMYLKPTHFSPKILPPGWNWRNAITFPAIGRYLKINRYSSGSANSV
ncbi:hypothetical protein D3C73_1538000 [compost metagenome]